MKRLRWLILAAIVAGAVWYYMPARIVALKLAGRSPECPLKNALESPAHIRGLTRHKDELLAGSHLVEKDPAGYHLWDTPMGRWWIPQGDDMALPFNLAEQRMRIYGTGERAVQAGDIVLDCGANVGVYTRLALEAGAKTVVAIEPAPENLECLRRNFPGEIAAGRVVVVPKGVWDRDDFLTLARDPGNTAADTFVMNLKNGEKSIQVPLTTIDKLVGELNLPRVDYIKMDIEGAEQRALAGARATLAKFHPRMALSAYHMPTDPVKIPEMVRQGWPGYGMECGPCAIVEHFRIRPDVLYFR